MLPLGSRSQLSPIVKASQMISNHFENIATYFNHRITNAGGLRNFFKEFFTCRIRETACERIEEKSSIKKPDMGPDEFDP